MNLHKFRVLLEINDVSFNYYLVIYLFLLGLDFWKEDFFVKVFNFPLSRLMWFVIASGVLKLFFNLDKLISWSKQSYFWFSKQLLSFLFFLKEVKDYFYYLFREFIKSVNSIFSWSLVFYLLLLLIEEFKNAGLVQKTFFFEESPFEWFLDGRMNWLLGWVILTGAISVLLGEEKKEKKIKEKIAFKDYLFIFGLGLFGAYLIFYKTKELGWLSYVISSISGLLIILLSVIILKEEDEPTNRDN